MMVFIAFLAGFYVGVFTISLLVIAGRRKEKDEMPAVGALEDRRVRQVALF